MSDAELVKAVAEEVMGWKYELFGQADRWDEAPLCPHYELDRKWVMSVYKWQPLHRADHWWMVVERMRELGWYFAINNYSRPMNYVEFYRSTPSYGYVVTDTGDGAYVRSVEEIGRVVMEAALAAVRGEEEG